MLHIELRFLQFINIPINLLQFGIVGSTIEVSVGGLRYVAKRLRINLHRDIDILHASCHRHRIRRHLVGAHTDGVDSDAIALGYFGCSHRRDVAHVVTSIREQDYHLALRLGVLQSAHGIRQTHAHCGTVVDESAGSNIGSCILQQAQQTGVVGGHRALGERLARKDGQSDVVGRTARDKLVGHILRRLHAVRLQILGKHGGRNVHGKHDIDALHRLVVPRIVRLRAGHGANDEHEGDASQHHRQMDESHAQALGRKLIHSCIAHAHRWLALLPAQEIP